MKPASTTDTVHITTSCRVTGSDGSMNCGRKAVKKAMVLGLVIATTNPRQACTCPASGAASTGVPAWRQAWMPSQTR